MLLTSPLTTALNHTLHSSPNITSPTTVAFGAIKQVDGIVGIMPFTGNIYIIRIILKYE
jgi:hypothetical protein